MWIKEWNSHWESLHYKSSNTGMAHSACFYLGFRAKEWTPITQSYKIKLLECDKNGDTRLGQLIGVVESESDLHSPRLALASALRSIL